MRKASPLKLAFIGGGTNSAVGRVHQIASQMDKRFELVAGCFSQDPEQNQDSAQEYGVDRYYPDLDSLLASEAALDAIAILTPTPQHTNDIKTCIQAGLPIICEKALTNSVDDAQTIQSLIQQHQAFLCVTYNYTGYPMLRELRQLIAAGKFGQVEQVHIEMPQEGFARIGNDGKPVIPQAWRLSDGPIPTIGLDLGVHVHHLVKFLTQQTPLELVASQQSYGSFHQVIDNTVCIAHYSNDMLCNIWFSKAALGHRNGLKIRIYGSEGSAEWLQSQPEDLHLNDNQGHHTRSDRGNSDIELASAYRYNRFKVGHPSGFIEAFANLYTDIADAILAYQQDKPFKSDYVFSVDDALEGLKMLQAMSASSNKLGWIKL